ncbi:MAG: thiamine pyrophosphate-dependent enzyme [Melioribacteraceae bacterium]|nr:thiamine pyrophosphate-dependent enzyme [Melioribacteraceae bacterium]
MPKSIIINPKEVRKAGLLKFKDIELNQYKSDFGSEVNKYGEDKLKQVLIDMFLIREFETSLNKIKTEGAYHGIEYNHKGPAHLSMGQEAAAVGQALTLDKDDFIFGSHRSHGEILAKSFSAIAKTSDDDIYEIMKMYMGGDVLKIVEANSKYLNVKDLAYDFILYGVMAEIFAKVTGFHKGLGGSMHAFFAPLGSMPNNAIVGGSADIATGAALYKRINKKSGIVISNIGDGASACGPTWEALSLASMDQYRTLWGKEAGGAPPILFNYFNNFYGMGGQTFGETMGFGVLARIGAGINEDQLHAERIDGCNPLAVADAIERKRKILEAGKGPVLLDTITYRFSGHSPSDASTYRSKEEVELWEKNDSIVEYSQYLIDNNLITKEEVEELRTSAQEKIKGSLIKAIDLDISPRKNIDSEYVSTVMFSNSKMERYDDREPEVLLSLEENSRVKSLKKKERYVYDKNGKTVSKNKMFLLRDALFEALMYRAYIDPTMVLYGEENRDWGGAFAVYRGMTEALPYHRLFNSPIAEGAIVGSAVGYALSGGRAVVELMYSDFLGRAGDEVFNQMSKWQSMSAGILKMPLVLRISVGNKYGAQHSQDWTSMVAHIPGLKVMFPATPYDAKGMMNLALSGTDPVVFFESQKLYDVGEMFAEDGVPQDYYEVEEGEPAIRREGKDLTIVTIGATLYTALDAADILKEKYNIDAEVIDARFINPLNYDKIIESIKKTGKIVLASDAVERGSFLNTMAAQITQIVFDELDGPPVIVGARNWITPGAELEDMFFPQKEWIIDAIHERLLPLTGHQVTTNQTVGEMQYKNRRGV